MRNGVFSGSEEQFLEIGGGKMTKFTHSEREVYIQELKENYFDLVIIGGGITGAGIALQAAASGMKTALLDMQDFSEGTSSRSTKLVHGGIRYLKQFDVEVVAETVSERAIVQKIAPHIPKADPMLLPLYDEPGASFSLFELEIAMNLYDSLAEKQVGPYANQLLTASEVLERQPNLLSDHLIGGGAYLDFNNNDARLVIENVKKAQQDGATAVSRLKAVGFTYQVDQVNGVLVEDLLTGESFTIRTKCIVNASGPWLDTVRKLDEKVETQPLIRPTKGVHLVVDRQKLGVNQPIYFDSGENDGRMIFVLPRFEKTYFGTTDTDYDGDLAQPRVEQSDVDYLLKAVNQRFPDTDLTLADIESSWAGLRPLISSHAGSDYNGGHKHSVSDELFKQFVSLFDAYRDQNISRFEAELELSNLLNMPTGADGSPSNVSRGSDLLTSESGLLSIAGGKLTDYRQMAEGVLKEVSQQLSILGEEFTLVDSANYQVSGGDFSVEDFSQVMAELTQKAVASGLSEVEGQALANLYGTNLDQVLAGKALAESYANRFNLPIDVGMSLIYALDYEMIYSAVDFFLRRTNYLLFDIKALEDLAEPVLLSIQHHLSLSNETYTAQMIELEEAINHHRLDYLK